MVHVQQRSVSLNLTGRTLSRLQILNITTTTMPHAAPLPFIHDPHRLNVGEKYHKEQNRSYAGGWGRGDLIGMEVDMDRGTLSYYRNGEALGEAYNNLGKLSGREGGGVVPCVALIARGAKVSIHKHGE